MTGSRKYRAFWGALIVSGLLTLIAIWLARDKHEIMVQALNYFMMSLPVQLGVFAAGNVGEHFATKKNA